MKKPEPKSSGSRSSARKIAANQQNGRKGKGPISAAGKLRASQNSLKSGVYARALLLPGEDPAALHAHRDELWNSLAPQNGPEAIWVGEIIAATWRLQRLGITEGEMFVRLARSGSGNDCGWGFAFVNDASADNAFSKLGVYEAALSRRLHKGMHQLQLLRKQGWKDLPVMNADEVADNGVAAGDGNPPPAAGLAPAAGEPTGGK